MPLEYSRNYGISGNLVVVRDTETQERYEVYLHKVPGRDGFESILAIVERLNDQLPGRVNVDLTGLSRMWRCWVHQVQTPRFSAMRGPVFSSIGDASYVDHSGALACDMVEAYRFYVLGVREATVVVEPDTRVSRYERPPVI